MEDFEIRKMMLEANKNVPVAVDDEFLEKENTQMEKEKEDEEHVKNSEEEEEDGDDDDDLVGNGKGPGPVSDDSLMFPVQSIRRKRVRKGQVQYLVKWLGWPESANTWEPPENLSNVPDIIEAFEQSSGSGKQRKRRQTNVFHNAQLKKRQERSNTPYSLRCVTDTTADNHTPSAPLNDLNLTDHCAFPQPVLFADVSENKDDGSSIGKAKVCNGNDESDYDPKLSELKAATTNGHGADKPVVQCQEGKVAADSDQIDGQSKGVSVEQVQSDQSRGVRRKKSCSAKKLKEDSHAGDPVTAEKPIGTSASTFEPARTGTADHEGNNSKKKTVPVQPLCNIIKILRPLGCSPTASAENLCVTFMALRSDGTEVIVDNRYLKSHYPQLLIQYYEQRIRYNP
ncbi:PREDICTED: chromo domain-containing protein LHP1-like isoform X2 [Lupinus angustifolius]|uniref:chromo domain-containing protein LHP1-like isoform X2 n=1 Tax=Lupinus angustifolius TaxID=3871 RepID=UPI00092EF75E|nr:PREDICTED: chromo domain-containing protein LHP1-like isoform X2 [Lupinus angustifolius]